MHLYVVGATGAGKSKFLEHLIRQDVIAWRKSRCGVLVIDPHGSLYDSLMGWMAWHGIERPVIPIDLRRDDWIISYNVLRQRARLDPAVLVDNLTDAMAYVWGQSGTDKTPLFARWAGNVIRTLYETNNTLVEADFLTDRIARQTMQAMTSDLRDKPSRNDWLFAQSLSPKDFEAQIGSTVNRLQRFLRNKTMRCMFGQPQTSLDLGQALEEGSIILVSLATEGGRVSKENAELFATLLLADLWTAAQERGKRKGVKPFYLYLDEFQRFVSPTIAENLDEARGFGLHVTMAHQFPNQLLDRGEHGRRVLNSIMENASSKVVFRLSHEDNLKIMAKWLFMGVMNPDEIKHEMYSTKVLDYIEEYKRSYGDSSSEGSSYGRQEGKASGMGDGLSHMFHGEDLGDDPRGTSTSRSEYGSRSMGESSADSKSSGHSENWAPMLMPQIGQELSHVQFRSLEEQLHRAMAALFDQEQRQGVARLVGMRAPVSIVTPYLADTPTNEQRMNDFTDTLYARLPFAVPREKAEKIIARREAEFEGEIVDDSASYEPTTTRRRIGRR
jgi:hypothetical protein